MDTCNWRDRLQPEIRQLTLNNIMDKLKLAYHSGDHDQFLEFQKIAQSIEQKSYAGATSQSDYFEKIASKIILLEEAREREWKNKQEELYQKIRTMKENYLPELSEMYQKIATKLQRYDSLPQQPKSYQLEKLKAGQLPPPRMHSMSQPQSQVTQLQSHENQMNSQLQTTNIQG